MFESCDDGGAWCSNLKCDGGAWCSKYLGVFSASRGFYLTLGNVVYSNILLVHA